MRSTLATANNLAAYPSSPPSAFRVAQLTHVRRHARSKGTGHGDKSPTQTPGRFKNIRARRDALCVSAMGIHAAHVRYTIRFVYRGKRIAPRGESNLLSKSSIFPSRYHLPSRPLIGATMKEITGDEFAPNRRFNRSIHNKGGRANLHRYHLLIFNAKYIFRGEESAKL